MGVRRGDELDLPGLEGRAVVRGRRVSLTGDLAVSLRLEVELGE